MKTNKRWQQLYLDQFPPQDPKERDWLQWFTGGQSRCDDRGIPWSEAYCLRWRTAQNLQQGKHASYTIMLDDENNKDANRLEVILATDKRLILDCWHSHYYLMAFENLNSQCYVFIRLVVVVHSKLSVPCIWRMTGNHMSVGMHWCLVIQLDTTKDLYVSRVYHPASRRWCNTMIDAPNRHVGFWCSTIWREDVHSTIVAHLTVKPSIQEDVHEVTLQLWTFSLDTPLAHCTHTCRFSIDDTVVSDDNFKRYGYLWTKEVAYIIGVW
ncbi:hypothetical protein BDF22DRAFT_658343 [Syncephalis plumigaleata]|nr:hypothetical protein BDF22DRAFT_658343 [Syncephalis plumigaleata]